MPGLRYSCRSGQHHVFQSDPGRAAAPPAGTSRPDTVPDSYIRYPVNGLREDFDLEGVLLRINLRKGKNPYENRAKKRQ